MCLRLCRTITKKRMVANLGKVDAKIRIVLGILITIIGLIYQSWWGVAGIVLIITVLINWCPIYASLGINTRLPRHSNKGKI